jgi:hypothetical protein
MKRDDKPPIEDKAWAELKLFFGLLAVVLVFVIPAVLLKHCVLG